MDQALTPRPVRIFIASAALIVFTLYVGVVCSLWRADWLQDQQDLQSLQASVRFQPWDARTQWFLGRYYLTATQEYAKALPILRHVVELNPYDGRYWMDLATAHEVKGEMNESQEALQGALRAEPTSTEIAWQTANFYLALNDTAHALPLFRTAIQHDPTYTASALELIWRATKSVTQIVSQGLPSQPKPYFAFLKLLTSENQSKPANDLWAALVTQKFSFPVEDSFPYFDYLIQTNQIDQAKRVWEDLSRAHPELQAATAPNLVHNGGFETQFLNGGFDWRSRPTGQANVLLDTSKFHRGSRSLRIAFLSPSASDIGVFEYLPTQPSTEYRFGAYVETQDVITASGPRLSVEDPLTGTVLASTDEFLETRSWSQHSAEFVTGPDTHLVTLRIARIPSNSLIKGTFWLDDVELVRKSTSEQVKP